MPPTFVRASGRPPKMPMAAFRYVAPAALIDVLRRSGDPAAALAQFRQITPNPGNVMAHEIQHAELLVAAGHLDEAMQQLAASLVTANQHRSGYSKTLRLDFVQSSPDLAPLRGRADWQPMLQNPEAYLRTRRANRE